MVSVCAIRYLRAATVYWPGCEASQEFWRAHLTSVEVEKRLVVREQSLEERVAVSHVWIRRAQKGQKVIVIDVAVECAARRLSSRKPYRCLLVAIDRVDIDVLAIGWLSVSP